MSHPIYFIKLLKWEVQVGINLRVRPWYILFIYTKVWVYVWPTGVGGLAEEPYFEEELYEDQIADLSVEQVEGSLQ